MAFVVIMHEYGPGESIRQAAFTDHESINPIRCLNTALMSYSPGLHSCIIATNLHSAFKALGLLKAGFFYKGDEPETSFKEQG